MANLFLMTFHLHKRSAYFITSMTSIARELWVVIQSLIDAEGTTHLLNVSVARRWRHMMTSDVCWSLRYLTLSPWDWNWDNHFVEWFHFRFYYYSPKERYFAERHFWFRVLSCCHLMEETVINFHISLFHFKFELCFLNL